MKRPIDQAMLLAAGLGTRLRPLTLTTPKPLLPIDGCTLIDHQLHYLAAAGIERVAINLHHLGEQIRRHVGDGRRYGLTVQYSEEPEILGTGGGVKRAAPFFEGRPFIVLNADALIDADLRTLMEAHQESCEAATLVLKTLGNGDAYTPVSVDPLGCIANLGSGSHFFTGLSVIGPQVVAALPVADAVSCLIRDGIVPLMRAGVRVRAFLHEGYFNDLGTPERYQQARADVASGKFCICTSPTR